MNIKDFVSLYKTFGKIPQKRFEYDSNGATLYIGIAPWGQLSSDSVWIIEKYTYDADSRATQIQHSNNNVSWDNRATEVYG